MVHEVRALDEEEVGDLGVEDVGGLALVQGDAAQADGLGQVLVQHSGAWSKKGRFIVKTRRRMIGAK